MESLRSTPDTHTRWQSPAREPHVLVWAFVLYLGVIGLGVGWMAPRLLVGYLSVASGILASVLAIASTSEQAKPAYNTLAVVMLIASVSFFGESVLPSSGLVSLACFALAVLIAVCVHHLILRR